MSSVDSVNTNPTASAGATSSGAGATTDRTAALGKDTFMQLLMVQLQNQDPLQPQDNGQFLAQLAQFTSLEKLTSIDDTMQSVNKFLQSLAQAAAPTGGNA